MKIHVVQKGDTLWNIAKKYNVSFEELKAANTQLSNPDMIMPGMKIKVPSNSKAMKEVVVKETVVKESVVEHPYVEQKPKMQFQPMPMPIPQQKPIMMQPEIDIHQTYNLQLHQSQPQFHQQPIQMPMPHMPLPELPKAPSPKKEVKKEVKKEMKKDMKEKPAVQGVQQGMPQMPEDCQPVTPIMPGDGFDYPFPHPMGMPQVQGAQMMPHPHHEMHSDHGMMQSPQVLGTQMMQHPHDCMEMPQWNPQQTAGAGQHMKKPCGCGNQMHHPHHMHQMNPWGQQMPYGNHPQMGGYGPGMNQPFMGMGNMPPMGQPEQNGVQGMMNGQGMDPGMMPGMMMNGQGMNPGMMNGQGMDPGMMMNGQGMNPGMMNQGPGMMNSQGFEPYGMPGMNPGMMQPMPRFYEEQDEGK
ncbi:SafA/ExsA family spore coat assembly protein [Jeotgalibacillus sp. ET6]|uniref:SafA/ExsA family spore coat assembly protein n=1 Tax=Jeotgalibacillus sp. ET6 TaxID=3037260 RepID=UPI0024188836|nr:SafA/ExsA family spore coat assembly protein [Jeotgalibacillus sp. ET6]MDG5470933.1 SafA/ExsA family spore coat assembly protein [Jeotgalibacillus sp. ET6]